MQRVTLLQGLPEGCQREPCMPMRSVVDACVRLTPAAGMHTCVTKPLWSRTAGCWPSSAPVFPVLTMITVLYLILPTSGCPASAHMSWQRRGAKHVAGAGQHVLDSVLSLLGYLCWCVYLCVCLELARLGMRLHVLRQLGSHRCDSLPSQHCPHTSPSCQALTDAPSCHGANVLHCFLFMCSTTMQRRPDSHLL